MINKGLEIKANSRGARSEFYFKYIRTASLHIERGEINKGWEIKANELASAATYEANCYICLCLLTMWEARESQILAGFNSPPFQSLGGGPGYPFINQHRRLYIYTYIFYIYIYKYIYIYIYGSWELDPR